MKYAILNPVDRVNEKYRVKEVYSTSLGIQAGIEKEQRLMGGSVIVGFRKWKELSIGDIVSDGHDITIVP